MEDFHNPHASETQEQAAYEQEIVSRSLHHHDPANTSAAAAGVGSDAAPTSDESLSSKLQGFVADLADFGKSVKSFVELETHLGPSLTNPEVFPEAGREGQVRRGIDLCDDEQRYVSRRKTHVRNKFAAFLGLDPDNVHPDDVPTIAFGGSGGGYRAMLAVLGYGVGLKKSGLWDLLTYIAGVSGSCWAIAQYYTLGNASMEAVIEHCKNHLSPHHPLSPDAIGQLLGTKQGELQTFGPLIQKHKSGLHTVPMDLYAVFITGYLFKQPNTAAATIEAAVAGYQKPWWKWTDAIRHLEDGKEPMPLLTAIRHERPWRDWHDPEHPFADTNPHSDEQANAPDAWFQWFEMSPYEVGCDELRAWVPTWAFGRKFEEGKSVQGLPEQSLSLLVGLCVSAPAGPLSSYLSTIERNLPKNIIGNTIMQAASGIAKLWGKSGTEVFEDHHPLHACNEYNFLWHYTPTAPNVARPPGIENSPRIHLVDSGMDNNCPTYVMLNPARAVDVILNMDASSDVQKDSFPQRVQQIGSRRGIDFKRRHSIKADPDTSNPDRFKGMYAQIYDGTMCARPATVVDSYGNTVTNPPGDCVTRDCTMVYMPLLPNERAVPGYDPSTAKFSGSYNLVWTPEQVEMILNASEANFNDGLDTIKEALRDAWKRKKALREQA
ncbi:Lysophospholipase [Mycena chlorophos]|uniref:Lysophospholipase n=1 Tax=Mycena chlorophos TaxID=658473 RepID=A0A8H6S357_MYCCL|nr:Lysophospholipase [Mycena chlorophos]